MREGKDYDEEWGKSMRGKGKYEWKIGRRLEIEERKIGLKKKRMRMRKEMFEKIKKGGKKI